jgi:hypothetical protein
VSRPRRGGRASRSRSGRGPGSSCRPAASWRRPTANARCSPPAERVARRVVSGPGARSRSSSTSRTTRSRFVRSGDWPSSKAAKRSRASGSCRKAGFSELVANQYIPLAAIAVEEHLHATAARYLDDGIAYCSERGYELFRLYLLTFRARLELNQGRWRRRRTPPPRCCAFHAPRPRPHLVARRARTPACSRGDPGSEELLDEAWASGRTRPVSCSGCGPSAAAKARGCLAPRRLRRDPRGDRGDADAGGRAQHADPDRGACRLAACVRASTTGSLFALPSRTTLELAGRPGAAAERWAELGSPYESALALAQADDVEAPAPVA